MWHSWAEVAWCSCAMCQLGFDSLLMWVAVAVPCGISLVRWLSVVVSCGIHWDEVDHWLAATWHCGGAHLSVTCTRVGPTCWHGPMRGCHVALGCWVGPIWCCHVAHPLSSSVLYLFCFLHPVCTQDYCYPQIAPRVILIKSQPLINPFNLFYLPWIYFNSSTYPKIMKFSPKISKFMMIIPVIFNSIFTPASLN
jgi:hypothetical protein